MCVKAITGYLHPGYARALAEFGAPAALPGSGGWVLERPIPGVDGCRDAMGCYPLFACPDWSQLPTDLESLGERLVSLALVADPFGEYDADLLGRCFPDVVLPFKPHYVVDLDRPAETFVDAHHRRNARRALRELDVERLEGERLDVEDASGLLEEWSGLYANLVRRHGIRGIAAFSRRSFAGQIGVPGMVALRARRDGITVGMTLWYVQNGVGYYHLGAYSDLGYALRVSFALFWMAIDTFAAAGIRCLDLGGGAGVGGDGADGLSRFKQGWATGARTAYFCGRIFDRARYAAITQARGIGETAYFPAYRKGEFGGS